MTDETTQALLPVKVTQADRDLIVTLMRPLAKSAIEHKAIDFIAEGRGDDAEAVQLVAKHRLAHSLPSQADAGEAGFQAEVGRWMLECFGEEIAADRIERADRFLEEALELAQTIPGFTVDRARALVEYVFDRPVGERGQEVGGVGVTLAALCNTYDLNIRDEWERELARVWTKVDAIRAKQASKPVGSALPVAHSRQSQAAAGEDVVEKIARLIDPSSWAVFDAEKARMLRKYKGENIGWPADQYQHKASMDTARRILATLTAPPTSELVDAKQADTLHSAYIASLDSLTLPTSGEEMRLREAEHLLSAIENTSSLGAAILKVRRRVAALTKGAE